MNTIEHHLLDNVKEYLGFARKRLSDPDLAADAVQESLLKALKAADQIRDEKVSRHGSIEYCAGRSSIFTGAVTRAIERSPNWSASQMPRSIWN